MEWGPRHRWSQNQKRKEGHTENHKVECVRVQCRTRRTRPHGCPWCQKDWKWLAAENRLKRSRQRNQLNARRPGTLPLP